MRPVPMLYCPTCRAMQGVRDWRDGRESLAIELEPCGHVIVRSARLEWRLRRATAA